MLRRRILASSMASVMALTSVVGVAFAADTDVDTKAGLEKYIKDFDKFLDDGINDYGEVAANQFLDAIDHAKTVIDDKNAKAADCAAAYAMIKTMRDKMVPHDATELAALIKDCKPDYDSENILNEKLEDNIYDEDAFSEFAVAYEDAEYYVVSDDGRLITESYMNLDAAWTKLKNSKLETVTKAQFRAALRDYDAIIRKQHDYESWRRGKCSVKPTTSNTVRVTGEDKTVGDITTADYITYGQLFDIIYGPSDGTKTANASGNYTALRTSKLTGNEGETSGVDAKYIWWEADTVSATNLDEFIRGASDAFVAIKESSETSNPEIVNAYEAALDAVKVFNGWTKDSVNSGSEASVRGILKDYHNRLVLNFNETDVLAVLNALKETGDDELVTGDVDLNSAKTRVKGWLKLATAKNTIGTYFIDGTAGSWSGTDGTDFDIDAELTGGKLLAKGTNVLQYINVPSTLIKGTPTNADATGMVAVDKGQADAITAAGKAVGYAEAYLGEMLKDKTSRDFTTDSVYGTATGEGIYDLDEYKLAAAASDDDDTTCSPAEWTIVYRALKYAMDDLYGEIKTESYTKRQVETLLDEAYDWLDKTGDVDVFKTQNTDLVDATEATLEWLRESDKMKKYKDGEKVAYTAVHHVGTNAYIGGTVTAVNADATTTHKYLNKYLKALKEKFASYEYSYREIKDLVGDVYADIAGGDVTETEKLTKALADCAEALSVLEATNIDNEAFDDDRVFNEYNRLLTKKDGSDKPNASETALKTAYEALQKEYDAAKKGESLEPNVNGDTVVDTNDVAELMKLVLSNKADVSKHDFNGDKVVDVLDAKQLLTDILAGKYNA